MLPFASWCTQNGDKVKLAHPDLPKEKIQVLLASQWEQLLDAEKQPFEEKYQIEQEWYEKEKAGLV